MGAVSAMSFSRATAVLATTIACLALSGWVFSIPHLISVVPGLVPMNPVSATCFILASLSLWLLSRRHRATASTALARILACTVVLVAASRLATYVSGADLGIDQTLFREKLAAVAFGPNRMAPTTAVALVLVGIGLILRDLEPRIYRAMFQFCGLAVAAIALFAITSYAYATFSFSASESPTPMALHTAVTFLVLSAGLLAIPRRGSATEETGSIGTMVASGFAAMLAVLAAVGIIAYQSTADAISDARRVAQTLRLIEALRELHSAIQDVESGSRGYVIAGADAFLTQFRDASAHLPKAIDNVAILTADNPSQQKHLDALKPLIADRMAHADHFITLRQRDGLHVAATAVQQAASGRLMDDVRAAVAEMSADAERVREDREKRAAVRSGQTLMTVVAGSLMGMICVAVASLLIGRSINQQRNAEKRIVALNHALELRNASLDTVNKELESFSYSVSHDLRAPLRSIDGFSQVLLDDYASGLDPEGRAYLGRVRGATQRMGQLIDDMLNLSRVTRTEMRRENANLSAMAKAVVDEMRQREPGRIVEAVIAPQIAVMADPHLMRVVMENLLGNAWKFSSKCSTPRIEFGICQDNGADAYFVRDNGAGFNMEYANKLFGAFQRLHAMSDFPGTGIGLATVQRIVHRHGGKVWAQGEVGNGATFFFTIGSLPPPEPISISHASEHQISPS
jgi:signal transduction histidine kinase